MPSRFIRDDPLGHEAFVQWLTRSTEAMPRFCTAVLYQDHWSPIKLETTDDGIQVHTTHWLADKISQWAMQYELPISFVLEPFNLPTVFQADCGFQVLGYLWSEVSKSTYSAIQVSSAIFWRTNYLLHICKHATPITAHSWQWGGAIGHEEIRHQLGQLLIEHGVFPERIQDRVTIILEKISAVKVGEALQGSRKWADLKQFANRVGLKLIQGDELDAQIRARQSSGSSGSTARRNQKGANQRQAADKESHARIPCLTPNDIMLPTGIFKEVPDVSLRQLQISQIGPAVSGVIVVDCQEANMLLRQPQPMSSKGLGLLIIDDHSGQFAGQGELVRFPATFVRTSEPIIISARLVQVGTVIVMRHLPEHLLSVDQVQTATIRILAYRDESSWDWSQLQQSPAKNILSHYEFLRPETKEQILDVWDRQWLTLHWTKARPAQADVFTMTLRIQEELVPKFLDANSLNGCYAEPRSSDGRSVCHLNRVIWLPNASKGETIVAKGSAPVQCSLVRHGNRFGLRCKTADAAALHSKYRADVPFLRGEDRHLFIAGPFPEGTTKSGLQRLLSEWHWDARPLNPRGRTADSTGISWVIQASANPMHWVYTCAHGDVLITVHPKQVPQKTTQLPLQILASSRTLDVLQKEDGEPTDPLQTHDPWAKSKVTSKPSQPATLTSSQLDDIENRITAKLGPMLKADSSGDVEMQDASRKAIENKFNEMAQKQAQLEQRFEHFQQQTVSSTQQLHTSVQTLNGRVEAQGHAMQQQMENTLQSHLEKIEAMLSKRHKLNE